MKIFCEHCGSSIDLNKDRVCPGCKAPYNNNKEYIKLKEKGEKFQADIEEKSKQVSRVGKTILIIFGCIFGFSILTTLIGIIFGFSMFGKIFGTIDSDIKEYENEALELQERLNFNSDYDLYKDSSSLGFDKDTVISIIDLTLESEKMYSNHTISIYYNNTIYTTEDEKKLLLSSLDDNGTYSVDFSNDSNNYINKITIKKIK